MFSQIKYSLREGGVSRLVVFGAILAVNLVFGGLAASGAPFPVQIVGISLSGTALGVFVVMSIIAAARNVSSLFRAPNGYSTLLAPVPAWKILLGRLTAIIVPDIIGLAVGVIGVVWQSLMFTELPQAALLEIETAQSSIVWPCLLVLFTYIQLILLILFGHTLSHSVFYRYRARGVLAVLAVLVTVYLSGVSGLLLFPVARVTSYGLFFHVAISLGFNAGTIAAMLLSLCKSALLFFAGAHLIDRRINI